LHRGFVERRAQAIASAEHVIAPDTDLIAEFLEDPHFLLQQYSQLIYSVLFQLIGQVRQRAQ
jgi:hypothetical protein